MDAVLNALEEQHAELAELLDGLGAADWQRPTPCEGWTVADVVSESDRFAAGLEQRGVKKGDRVAILLGNRPETLFAWFGANQLGAIAAPLNPAFKPAELAGLLGLTNPRVLLADEHRELAEAACASLMAPPELVTPADFERARGATHASNAPEDVAVKAL